MPDPNDSFYAHPTQITNSTITLKDKEAHHIIHVLRKKNGDEIFIVDGRGNKYKCEITDIETNALTATIVQWVAQNNEPAINLALAVALPKKDKFELIIEKCTELGVNRFIPLISERTQVKAKSLNPERCKKIAISAMKQSQRSFLPEVTEPGTLKKLVQQRNDFDLKIVAHEKIDNLLLREALSGAPNARNILLAIGPEGGFSEEEISFFKRDNYVAVSLGKRRLRTETAAIVASAIVLDFPGK